MTDRERQRKENLLTPEQEIAGLKLEIKALKKALGAFIAWSAQSTGGPIRLDEASTLLNWMNGHD